MKNKILWLAMLLFPVVLGSCSKDEDIVFDHERQMFEIQDGKILLEVILPGGTTDGEEIYISGAFNGGDEVAVGKDEFKLIRTDLSTIKRAVYLDPSTFVDGKTLADGFHFVSSKQRQEVDLTGADKWHYDNPGVGTSTNITVDRWAAFYDSGDEGGEDEDDGSYVPYLDDANEESVFFETDAEYVRIWAWGGDASQEEVMNIESANWENRPFMELVGKTKEGKNVFKFVFGAAPTNFLVSESDADGNQIGEDGDRPIKGAPYTKNGYYIKGNDYDNGAVPEVITQVGKPAGKGGFVPTISSADEESIFFESDAEYVRIWAWGGDAAQEVVLNIESANWENRPFMELVGKTKEGKNVFKFVFGAAPTNFLVSESDADGNQIGEDGDRPIKGAPYTKNGYYIKGNDYDNGAVPEVITKIK